MRSDPNPSLLEVLRRIEEAIRAGNANRDGGVPGEPVANNTFVNTRMVFPDAATQRRAIVNGESRVRDAERIA